MTGPTTPPPGVPADMPVSLAARPRDLRRGLPIPPVNVHANPHGGTQAYVDFTTINTSTSAQLAADRRCSLCGEPMKYWVAFLGTPRAAELLRFTDPPGHPNASGRRLRCARTSPSPGTGAPASTGRARASCRPGRTGTNPPGGHWESPGPTGRWSCPHTDSPCTYRPRSAPCTPTGTARTGSYTRTRTPGDPADSAWPDSRQKPSSTPGGRLDRPMEVGNIVCDGVAGPQTPAAASPNP